MSAKDRRKSESKADKASGLVTINVTPAKLRAIFGPADAKALAPSTPAHGAKAEGAAASVAGGKGLTAPSHDNDASESTPATPIPATPLTSAGADGTPQPSASLAPPTDGTPAAASAAAGSKKKGVKRSSAVAGLDGAAAGTASGPGSTIDDAATPKARKPGPKKRAKVDDGANELGRGSGAGNGGGGGAAGGGAGGTHKLGPKASMGAINAGLRALDRSGKPCRRWAKGSFRLKSFTGVVWEIPRWKAPTPSAAGDTEEDASVTVTATASASASASASVSVDGSNKENEEKDKAGAKDHQKGGSNGTTTTKEKAAEPKKANSGDAADAKLVVAAAAANGTSGANTAASSDGDVEMTNASSAEPSPPAASTMVPTEAPTPVASAV